VLTILVTAANIANDTSVASAEPLIPNRGTSQMLRRIFRKAQTGVAHSMLAVRRKANSVRRFVRYIAYGIAEHVTRAKTMSKPFSPNDGGASIRSAIGAIRAAPARAGTRSRNSWLRDSESTVRLDASVTSKILGCHAVFRIVSKTIGNAAAL
jgi:hypothetical protein